MRATILGHQTWTPESRPLRVVSELVSVNRWGRALIDVVEGAASDEPPWGSRTCVVVGTVSGAGDASAASLTQVLRQRWSGCEWLVVQAGSSTVPMSLLEALARSRRFDAVAWASVELTEGAELATALWLRAENSGWSIGIEHEHGPTKTSPRARWLDLNPCSGALELARGIGSESVSIRVDDWRIAVTSPGPHR